jgi:hypothetical protein
MPANPTPTSVQRHPGARSWPQESRGDGKKAQIIAAEDNAMAPNANKMGMGCRQMTILFSR